MPLHPLPDAARLGRALRTWRLLRRVKQAHAAELLGVSQATVSRWEAGRQVPGEAELAALRRLLRAGLDADGDRALARLVSASAAPLHLVCDLTHTLLALSPARAREAASPEALLGTSLWPHASEEIARLEAELPALGWGEEAAPSVEGWTGANGSAALRIAPGRFRWTRLRLSSGAPVRLVETLAA